LQNANKANEALELAQTYVQTEPEVGVHYERLASIHETQGNVDVAITNYEKAIELTPGDVKIQTYLKLAVHYILNEDIAAAEKILKNALLYTPSEFERRDIELQLIRLYLYQANLVEVLQKTEAEGMPLSYEMSNSEERAQHFRNTGELEKSAAYFKISLVMTNSYHEREKIANELLNIYIEQDRMDLALELYEYEVKYQKKRSNQRLTRASMLYGPSSIEIKFGGDDTRKTLIDAYKNRGKLDELRNIFERKLEKDVDNPAVIEMLAEIYWIVNDYQKAAKTYHALCEVEESNVRSFYLAAIAFEISNQPDMAQKLFKQAEAMLPFYGPGSDGSFLGALATICLKNELYVLANKLCANAITDAENSDEDFVLQTLFSILLKSRIGLAGYYSKNDMSDKAMEQLLQTGIVHEKAWLILGPFDNTAGIGYDMEYIPEDTGEIDLTEKYEGVDEQINWKKLNDDVLDGFIDLGHNINWRVSYAYATVTSPDKREVFFRFSSDDQGKIWLNGKKVFADAAAQQAILDRNTIPVTLKAGKNTILVKVCNEEIAWGFYLRITDADGKPIVKINDAKDN
ncbi:tetratricopeptide repeat protein, partial [Candidatus Poribacteria bacterium]|nr:tetratricopeptide repeat protein [Candidatus Poribacteria bacterium]